MVVVVILVVAGLPPVEMLQMAFFDPEFGEAERVFPMQQPALPPRSDLLVVTSDAGRRRAAVLLQPLWSCLQLLGTRAAGAIPGPLPVGEASSSHGEAPEVHEHEVGEAISSHGEATSVIAQQRWWKRRRPCLCLWTFLRHSF